MTRLPGFTGYGALITQRNNLIIKELAIASNRESTMKVNNSKIRTFKIKLLLFICLFFMIGCGVQENFNYTSKGDSVEFPWGDVTANLVGADKVGFFKVTRGSPYILWCYFTFDKRKDLEGTVQLSKVKIINARTNKLLVERDNLMEKPIIKTYKSVFMGAGGDPPYSNKSVLVPNMHHVGFRVFDVLRFKDQETEYDDLILQVKFIIKEGGNVDEYSAEMQLEKRYYKEFSSIFEN
jgi:hypothetical protein